MGFVLTRRERGFDEAYSYGYDELKPERATKQERNPSLAYPQREKPQLLQAMHPSFRIKFPPHSGQPGIMP